MKHLLKSVRAMTGITLAVLFLITGLFGPDVALAYSCLNHCYGINEWPGGTSGAYSTIGVVAISYNNSNEQLTNEMWLDDTTSSTCICWVEAGYIARSGFRKYFWEDKRPGYTWAEHLLADVPSGDINQTVNVVITRGSSTTFNVSLSSPNYSSSGQQSTANTMVPNRIDIGEELYGTSGVTAPQASWKNNKWADSNGTAYYQNSLGTTVINNPPYAGWGVGNNPTQNSTGGNWYANC